MRRLRQLTAALAVAAVVAACSTTDTPAGDGTADGGTPATGGGMTATDAQEDDVATAGEDPWTLVWEDTFDGEAGAPPDERWWNHETGGDGWGNRELQYYVDGGRAAALDGEGHLVITAAEGPAPDGADCWYGECRYTSARITTKGKVEVEYGRIEARAKLPAGDGMWPAFWMLGANIDLKGWPNAGEIDVMENIGREPNRVHGTVHGRTYAGGDSVGGSYRFDDTRPSDGFHTYAIEWEPERIRWYVDDVHYSTVLPSILPSPRWWAFDHPFFLILNLAVGGQWPGDPTEETVFPQEFVIDHVRIYEHTEPIDG